MGLLIECPNKECRYKNSEKYQRSNCVKCGADLTGQGRIWWVEYYQEGRRKRRRVGPWKRTAEQVLHGMKKEVIEEKYLGLSKKEAPKRIQFKEFVLEYFQWVKGNNKEWPQKLSRLRTLSKYFDNKTLDEISVLDVERFKVERRKLGRKDATINRELSVLKHLLGQAMKWGYHLEKNPVRDVKFYKTNSGMVRFLEKHEIKRLLDACPEYLKPLVTTALHTGMRKGELLKLKWEVIDLNRKLLFIEDGKGGNRTIPFGNKVLNELVRLKNERNPAKDGLVFLQPSGEPWSESNLGREFRTVVESAGITDCGLHTLRHTMASWAIMSGTDLLTLKDLLGHKTLDMVLRYAHLAPDFKTKAINNLEEALSVQEMVYSMDTTIPFKKRE